MSSINISISQKLAHELYALAMSPRIVAFDLSNESREELAKTMKPTPAPKPEAPKKAAK